MYVAEDVSVHENLARQLVVQMKSQSSIPMCSVRGLLPGAPLAARGLFRAMGLLAVDTGREPTASRHLGPVHSCAIHFVSYTKAIIK